MKATMKTRKATPRKHGTKTRKKKKPKYLSLRLQFSSETDSPTTTARMTGQRPKKQQQKISIFAEDMHDDHVAMLFHDSTDDNTGTSLHGILENSTTATITTEREEALSPYACMEEGTRLVRTAMRCKERDASEEKWVCYAEVVEEIKKEQEEVSSCFCSTDHHCRHQHQLDDSWWKDHLDHKRRSGGGGGGGDGGGPTFLALKLDYQEILNAWSDKGPLYVDEHVVPDLHGPNNVRLWVVLVNW